MWWSLRCNQSKLVVVICADGIQLLLMLRRESTNPNRPVEILAVSEAVFNRLAIYGLLDSFDLSRGLEVEKVVGN